MKKITFILMALIPFIALGQQSNWAKDFKAQRTFIENKGQFKSITNESLTTDIKFAFDGQNEEYFFTKSGVVLELSEKIKRIKSAEEKEWRSERKKKGFTTEEWKEFERVGQKLNVKIDGLTCEWIGSNPDVQIISEEKNQFTHSYSYYDKMGELKHVNNAPSFNKLTYKSIYPNIDVIYELHPEGGLKYSIVVHPGGNISTVKLKYSKDALLNNDGTIITSTLFGNITDHKPLTFYKKNQHEVINSFYSLSNNIISFNVDNYNTNNTIVIDPWTQTPAVSIPSGVWEVEADAVGNVYVIGGGTPMQLVKYNSAGTFQWIYNTPYDTNNGDWLGALATDNAGNSYVTRGSSAAITKVNTTGGVTYSVNGGGFDEYWQISFNCDQTKLLIGGTRLPFFPTGSFKSAMIFDVNPANGSVISSVNVGWSQQAGIINNPDEVRSISSSFNAKYYFLTLDSIAAIDQMLGSSCPNPLATGINSTYNFSYKCEDFRPDNGNGPMSAIVADANFVYTQNGSTVHKRDLNTYGVLATATIPGGINTGPAPFTGGYQAGNSGIAMDNCGNVYVGSSDRIVKFDGNLNLLTSTAVSYRVSDVEVSPSGDIVLCGSTGTSSSASRTGYVQSVSMAACAPLTLICCDANFCPVGPLCTTDAPVNLNPNTAGGTWSSSPITAGLNTSTGIFSPSVAGAGTFTITYTIACGTNSIQVVVGSCSSMTACEETNGNITVSGGVATYTWAAWTPATSTPITNSAQCTACGGTWFFGTCLQGATPITSCSTPASWVNFGTGVTVTPPVGADTIRITDGLGGTLVINGISSLPSCSVTCDATITAAGPFCVNAPAVNLTAAQTGGTWSGTGITNTTNGTFNPATAGAGSHTITYTLGCGDVDTETIVVNDLANAGFSYSSGSYCLTDANPTPTITGLAGGTFTINNSGVINASTGVLNITGSGVGSFTVTYTTTGSCPNSSTFNITITSSSNATITQAGPYCQTASTVNLTAVSPGGTWTGTGITNGVLGTFNPTTAGVGNHVITYTLIGSCGSVDTMTIVVNASSDASFSYPSGSYCLSDPNPTPTITGTLGGTFTINNSGVINSSTGVVNLTSSGLGSFVVTYNTNGACPDTNTFNISITNTTNATITQAGPYCQTASTVNLTAVSPGGTWTGTGITNSSLGTFNPTTAGVGNHVVTYTITGTCGSVDTMTIVVNASSDASFSYPSGSYCLSDPNPTPTITGTLGGTFTINNSGVINSSTGVVNLTSSGLGSFVVTYNTNGACPDTNTFNISITNTTNATITQAGPFCQNAIAVNLTAVSPGGTWTGTGITNGSLGTFNPTTAGVGNHVITYTITGSCGSVDTMTIVVNASSIPTFAAVAPICSGAALAALPTTSTNAITGTWSPAINNTTTTLYTFTPTAGQCATTTTMSITVNTPTTPTFAAVAPICTGSALSALPTTSINGITGTWSPAINNTATTLYTFTPTAGLCATTTSVTITVNPNLTPTFTALGPICSGSTLSALPTTSNNSITGTWSPALNNTTTTTYTFTPTAGQCATTTTLTITVNSTPTTPTFTAVSPICTGDVLAALPTTSNNGITGTWSPALNNTTTTTYTFTPTAGQCATTTTLTINVNTSPTTPTFTAVAPICSGAALSALPTTSNNGVNGTWSPAINNTATTTYTFTPTAGQCATTTTLSITVDSNVTPTFTAVAPICSGAALSALPTTSTNGVTGTWSPAINNTATTIYTFTPTAGLCATTTTLTITVTAPTIPTFTAVTPICIGESLAPLPTTSNNSITGTWSPSINDTTTTTYTFTPTAGLCATTTTMTITVSSPPIALISGSSNICFGQNVTLTASGGTNYIWNTGDTTTSITNSPNDTTDYWVVTSVGSCTDSAFFTVNVVPTPNVVVTPSPTVTIIQGNSIELTATLSGVGATTYVWTPSTDLSCTNCPVTIASPDVTTTYCATTIVDGCPDTTCVLVNVDIVCGELFVPTAFSPNSDGVNDCLSVYNNCIESMDFKVFSRWGEVVYQSIDVNDCWDGTFKGTALNTAVFVYRLDAVLLNGEEVKLKGNVSLIK